MKGVPYSSSRPDQFLKTRLEQIATSFTSHSSGYQLLNDRFWRETDVRQDADVA
jgi:hypothetical protein